MMVQNNVKFFTNISCEAQTQLLNHALNFAVEMKFLGSTDF